MVVGRHGPDQRFLRGAVGRVFGQQQNFQGRQGRIHAFKLAHVGQQGCGGQTQRRGAARKRGVGQQGHALAQTFRIQRGQSKPGLFQGGGHRGRQVGAGAQQGGKGVQHRVQHGPPFMDFVQGAGHLGSRVGRGKGHERSEKSYGCKSRRPKPPACE